MARPKLKWALDAFKERDYAAEKQTKMRKNAEKKKKAKGRLNRTTADGVEKAGDTGEEEKKQGKYVAKEVDIISEGDSDEEIPQLVDASAREQDVSSPDDHESGSEETESNGSSDSEGGAEEGGKASGGDSTDGESDGEYSDVDLSDIENEDDLVLRDVIPHQRLTINNTAALLSAHSRIALPLSSLPISEHLSIVSPTHIDIPDINDDLNRELAFYTQALYAANTVRQSLHDEGVPFSRPSDYFAEMVKTDDHMGKIRQKLVNEAADRKAVQEARKQKDLKKFGKQVQVAKLQERQKQKRETLEKINALKRSMQPITNVTKAQANPSSLSFSFSLLALPLPYMSCLLTLLDGL